MTQKLQELKMKIIKLNLDSISKEFLKTGDYNDNFNLEDVLRALDKKSKEIEDSTKEHIFNKIEYIKDDDYRMLDYITWFGWKWGKPLHEQDEPTINLLHNILC